MKNAVDMDSGGKIFVSSFMKIGTGVQAISRIFLKDLRDCNIVITDERDLRITPCRWSQVSHDTHAKIHKDWLRNAKVIGKDTHTDTDSKVVCHKPTFIFKK
jgi:hypothetical protein